MYELHEECTVSLKPPRRQKGESEGYNQCTPPSFQTKKESEKNQNSIKSHLQKQFLWFFVLFCFEPLFCQQWQWAGSYLESVSLAA